MAKMHTREKRKLGLNSHSAHKALIGVKKNRPKTFPTEEKAHAWAHENGHAKAEYSLKSVKRNKRFQIVKKTA